MTELVIALLMIVNGEINEARIQTSMSDCLKGKRTAERDYKEGIQYKCDTVKAELETNIDGSKSIKKILND